MGTDDDIAAALPVPPRPAPARRAATLERALRRFDGEEGAASTPARTSARRPNRYYLAGAVVSAALVALVALPVTRETMRERPGAERGEPSPARATSVPEPAASSAKPTADDAVARSAPAPANRPAPAEARTATPVTAVPATDILPSSEPVAAAPPPPPPPPPEPAVAAAEAAAPAQDRMVVTGSRIRQPNLASPKERVAARSADSGITVSGSRIRTPRGDWNACTLDDPARRLSACRSRSGAAIAEGLSLGWQGDLDGAVAAFDRAVVQAPRSSLAFLNRGMAYRRKGDLQRAQADLDRAVRLAPDSARALYQRSLLRRQQGDAVGAAADARRAIALDPGYAAVLEAR